MTVGGCMLSAPPGGGRGRHPRPGGVDREANRPIEREASVSLQVESRHFLRVDDVVEHSSGVTGQVVEGWALYALVQWSDGRRQEVEQFDPQVVVVERAVKPS